MSNRPLQKGDKVTITSGVYTCNQTRNEEIVGFDYGFGAFKVRLEMKRMDSNRWSKVEALCLPSELELRQ